jgi:hypothetical protein
MEIFDAMIISASGLSTSNEIPPVFPAGSAAKVITCTRVIEQTKNRAITDRNQSLSSFPMAYSSSVVN